MHSFSSTQSTEEKEAEPPSQPLDLGFPDDDDDGHSPEGYTCLLLNSTKGLAKQSGDLK